MGSSGAIVKDYKTGVTSRLAAKVKMASRRPPVPTPIRLR
jgi:hypothetical protein